MEHAQTRGANATQSERAPHLDDSLDELLEDFLDACEGATTGVFHAVTADDAARVLKEHRQ